jgi:integration host factor subunit alpha
MVGKSVTRTDLTDPVYQQGIVTKDCAADLVDQVLKTICSALKDGENVKPSSFGIFTVRDNARHMGRNPKTCVEVPIEPRRVNQSTASPALKSQLNRVQPQYLVFDTRDADARRAASHGTTS